MRLLNIIAVGLVRSVMIFGIVVLLIMTFGYSPDTIWTSYRIIGFGAIILIGVFTGFITDIRLIGVVRNIERGT